MAAIEQLVIASQQQHARYHALFGADPADGDGWRHLSRQLREVSEHVQSTRRDVLALRFSTNVDAAYGAATRNDHVPLEAAATTTDTAAEVTNLSAEVNVQGANAVAANATNEAARIAAISDPQSPAGTAAILAVISEFQGMSAATVQQATATEQALGQRMSNAGGSDTANSNNHVQLVDHTTIKEAPPSPSPLPDPNANDGGTPLPVSALGLPPYANGTLSAVQARTVYAHGELRMRDLNDRLAALGAPPELRARIMVEQRNALRTWTRALMSDRDLADRITEANPNRTWDDLVASNQAQGRQGDQLWNAIIDSSTHSRPSVNDALGVDPERPPPLPAAPASPPAGTSAATPGQGSTSSGAGSGAGSLSSDPNWVNDLAMSPEELARLAQSGDPLGNIAKMILQSPEYQAKHPPERPMA